MWLGVHCAAESRHSRHANAFSATSASPAAEWQPRLTAPLQAFCTCLNWTSNLLVSSTFPMLLGTLGIAGAGQHGMRDRLFRSS